MDTFEADNAFVATLNSNKVRHESLIATLLQASSDQGWNRKSSWSQTTASTLPTWASPNPFQAMFEEELYRISAFIDRLQVEIELSAKALFSRANALSTNEIRDVQESYSRLHQLKMESRKNVEDSIALQDFFTNSRNLLFDVASRAEQVEKHREPKWCTSKVHDVMPKAHLNTSLVCIASDIFGALRQAEEKILNMNNGGSAHDTIWEAPSSFKRSTTKYWVKDEHLTKLMMICAIEAPLLVYGRKGPLTSLKSGDLKVSDGDKLWTDLATRITSVYFDSHDMKLYCSRLKREEGAQLLRVRWYGHSLPTGNKHIFLELKTHHEKWVTQKSVKERATIMERHMVEFLRPSLWDISHAEKLILKAKPKLKDDAVELAKQASLLLRMHNLVVKYNLTACVRSVYDRAAFQSAKSNDVRLTLDRNVTLINERSKESHGWCLSDSEAQEAQAKVVPFNVFEIKLAGNNPMPIGLANADTDQTIVLAMKFSKYLTGAGAFNAVPMLPYWAAHPRFFYFFDLDKQGGRQDDDQGAYTLMDSRESVPLDSHKLPSGIVIAMKNQAQVGPVTYFSNERTFVQWISSAILLLTVSGYLINAGHDYDMTAATIALAALVIVLFSTHLFFQRLLLLRNREPFGYFNKANPIFLTAVLGFTIVLVLASSIKGSEFLGKNKDQRLLKSLGTGRLLDEASPKCPQEVLLRTDLLINEKPSSFVVDLERHSFLVTSKDSIYMQSISPALNTSAAQLLIRINRSHLQGVTFVGDRLFTVANGPGRNELIEMAWWGADVGHKKLRMIARWTLEDKTSSNVKGFSYLPSTDGVSSGHFLVTTASSVHVYSVPTKKSPPIRMKSLNMKVLGCGMENTNGEPNSKLTSMNTFDGVTYVMSNSNLLDAWNMTDGTWLSAIELPSILKTNDDGVTHWTSFALERSTVTSTEMRKVGGGGGDGARKKISSNEVILHLMADGHISSFRVLQDTTKLVTFPSYPCQTSFAHQ